MAETTNRSKAVAGSIVLAGASLVAFITGWEGNEETTYLDMIGKPTVCAGITDPDIAVIGKTYTEEQCRELNAQEIAEHGERMASCVEVPLSQGEYDAYTSFAYNVGTNAFCGSTLVKKLNAGNRQGACDQLLRWNQAGGRVVTGLDNRRKAEHRMCVKAITTGPKAVT